MRSEGFSFLSGGLGAGPHVTRLRPHVRERSRHVRGVLNLAFLLGGGFEGVYPDVRCGRFASPAWRIVLKLLSRWVCERRFA